MSDKIDFDSYVDSIINAPQEPAAQAEDVEEPKEEKVSEETEEPQDEPQSEEAAEDTDVVAKAEDSKPEKRKFKIKTYGKEKELELDDEEITKRIQKAEAVDIQFKKNAEERKQLEALKAELEQAVSYIKSDPFSFIESIIGKDKAKEMYEDRVVQNIALQKMSPEQREAYLYEQQLKAKKEAMQRELEEIQAKESEERNRYYLAQLKEMTQDALKSVDLPITKAMHTDFLQFATPYIHHNDDVTYEELEVLAERFKEVKNENMKNTFNNLDGEGLYSLLGKENAEKLRKFFLKQAQPVKVAPKNTSANFQTKKTQEKWDQNKTRDYFDSL